MFIKKSVKLAFCACAVFHMCSLY